MESEVSCYLVKAEVTLLGGKTQVVFDAIEAASTQEAKSTALNSFVLAGDSQAISFGDATFLPGVIASLVVDVVGVMDMAHEDNEKWLYSIESWKEFERTLTQGKKVNPHKDVDLFGAEPPK